MIDHHTHVCHRMKAAQATNQSNRGWNFDRAVDESPLWLRAVAKVLRPRSIILLAMAGVISLWFL